MGLQRRRSAIFALTLALCVAPWGLAQAAVMIVIHRASQTVKVSVDGEPVARWATSTARRGYITPPGAYRPIRLERMWYSSKYENAPMPYSIFFRGGYAIHGTNDIR